MLMGDDRVPGDDASSVERWVCPRCGWILYGDQPPMCPHDSGIMERAKAGE